MALQADPRVAGLYNTGTNALAIALYRNLRPEGLPSIAKLEDIDLQYQVPWSKHFPANLRRTVAYPSDFVLPIVLIKDPFRWMKSMCKANYLLYWSPPGDHCPNLVPSLLERNESRYRNLTSFPVVAGYGIHSVQYDSLVDLWNQWNRQYFDADFPRLMIRFEDFLFRADEVMHMISNCTGLPGKIPHQYLLGESKSHGSPSNFILSLIKYGYTDGLYQGMSSEDIEYAARTLDPDLMDFFKYPQPDNFAT